MAIACLLYSWALVSAPTNAADLRWPETFPAAQTLADGDAERALAMLQDALERPGDEGWAEARFVAAQSTLLTGRASESLVYLNGLEAFLPEVADEIVALRARAYRQQFAWREAQNVWSYLVRKFPNSPHSTEAWYGIADAHYALGEVTAARAGYQTASRKTPHDEFAWQARFNIAAIDAARREFESAGRGFTDLAVKRANDAIGDSAYQRLEELVAQGRVAPLRFEDRATRFDRFLAGRDLEQAQRALAELTTRAQTAEHFEAIRFREAQLAYYRRDYAHAVQLLKALNQTGITRNRLTYLSWLARASAANDNLGEALAYYETLAADPSGRREAREALFKSAWLSLGGRRFEQAITGFERYQSRYPRDRRSDEVQWYLAWTRYRMGELDTAYTLLVALRTHFAGSELIQRAQYWEGRMAALLGRRFEALEAFGAVIAREPLSYYAVMARTNIRELGGEAVALAPRRMIAQLTTPQREGESRDDEDTDAPVPETPVAEASATPESPLTSLPLGSTLPEAASPEGRRLRRLVQLGLRQVAADQIQATPIPVGLPGALATRDRAQLYANLRIPDRAYRLAAIAFAPLLTTPPEPDTNDLFELAYPTAFERWVYDAASEFGTSPWLVWALMRQESAYRPWIRSPVNARGLMQILPATGAKVAQALGITGFAAEVLFEPATNVRFGTWYIAQLVKKFGGHPVLAIASYNAGPVAVSRWMEAHPDGRTDEFVEEIPYRETRNYVRRVISHWAVYATLYGGPPVDIPERTPSEYLADPSY